MEWLGFVLVISVIVVICLISDYRNVKANLKLQESLFRESHRENETCRELLYASSKIHSCTNRIISELVKTRDKLTDEPDYNYIQSQLELLRRNYAEKWRILNKDSLS